MTHTTSTGENRTTTSSVAADDNDNDTNHDEPNRSLLGEPAVVFVVPIVDGRLVSCLGRTGSSIPASGRLLGAKRPFQILGDRRRY